MRKTIIFGMLAALFGFAALAQASDPSRSETGEGIQVTRVPANDGNGDRHDRDTRSERSRERHDDYGDKRHEAREGHHEGPQEDEAAEHPDGR